MAELLKKKKEKSGGVVFFSIPKACRHVQKLWKLCPKQPWVLLWSLRWVPRRASPQVRVSCRAAQRCFTEPAGAFAAGDRGDRGNRAGREGSARR